MEQLNAAGACSPTGLQLYYTLGASTNADDSRIINMFAHRLPPLAEHPAHRKSFENAQSGIARLNGR